MSVIGPTLVFKGELSADEDLVIQGTIEGSIAHHKKNLTVGKEGRVKADINAASVTIEGRPLPPEGQERTYAVMLDGSKRALRFEPVAPHEDAHLLDMKDAINGRGPRFS